MTLPPPITVQIDKTESEKNEYTFTQPFRIGRDKTCEIQLDEPVVSRFHAEFWYTDGRWWVLDLQSANGTFVNGMKVERAPLSTGVKVEIGPNGPVLAVAIESEKGNTDTTVVARSSLDELRTHYFDDTDDKTAGQHTIMIRKAFKQVRKRERWRFAVVIALLVCLLLGAGTVALLKHKEVVKQKALAEQIFYAMKTLELEFAPLLKTARLSRDSQSIAQLKQYRVKRMEMEKKYDEFLTELEIYQKDISEEERIILRIARTFGECEIKTPPAFVKKILTYIHKWKTTPRLKKAINRAIRNGYPKKITEAMLTYDLPPQFLYIALQESNFRLNAVGPKTRFGIAKGIWQFLPSTAVYYGLRPGPLQHLRRPDPRDERHHFEKSTQAAAKYLRDIYDSEAQASGLLVMASYNWGERRVIKLIRQMPENPRERNFWQLLEKYRHEIPRETYDYVFYIFSAAVIGENPNLFGFEFENPLAHLDEKNF